MQMKKEFVKLKGDELTPFATITKFEADESYETSNKDSETVLNEVKEHMLSDNLFSAVKITGKFKNACSYDAKTRTTIYKIN